MSTKRAGIWIGVLLVVLAVSIPTGFALLANETDSLGDHYDDRGSAMGKAYASGSDQVVLRINGHDVTEAEFLDVRALKDFGQKRIVAILGRAVPDSDPAVENREWLEDCLNCYIQFLHDDTKKLPESYVAQLRPVYKVHQSYDLDVVTVARLLLQYTSYDAGVEAGHSMTDAEVKAVVDRYRFHYDRQGQTISETDSSTGETYDVFIEHDHETTAYVKAVGETKYWNEILPARTRRDGVASKWLKTLRDKLETQGVSSVHGAVLQQHAQLIKESTLEITGALTINATRDQALEFLVAKFRVDGYEISLTQ